MKQALVIRPSGGMGGALAAELLARGFRTTALVGSERKKEKLNRRLEFGFKLETAVGKLTDVDVVSRAGEGADAIFFHANTTYDEKANRAESLRAAAAAAKRLGIRLVALDGVYRALHPSYERELAAVAAEFPETVTAVRLPEVYGASARNTVLYYTLKKLARGEPGVWFGDPDAPREYAYLTDAAKVAVDLADAEPAFPGRIRRMTGFGQIGANGLLDIARAAVGAEAKLKKASGWQLAALQLWDGRVKELKAGIRFVPERESDEEGAAEVRPKAVTPYERGIRETLAELAKRSGS